MDSFFSPAAALMKYLLLLSLLAFVLIEENIASTDDYSISVVGAPLPGALPELAYGPPEHPVLARSEILDAHEARRSLTYRFYLSPGTYEHLHWNGHGVALPAAISIRNHGQEEAARLRLDDMGDLVSAASGPLVLPAPGFSLRLAWLSEKLWLWVLAAVFFFLLRGRLMESAKHLLKTPVAQANFWSGSRRIILLALLCLAAVWPVLFLPGALRFDVGDDPAMEMLASGYVTGHPSEYLIFINVLIGFFLKGLYLLAPGLPWYPLLLIALTLFCLVAITALLLPEETADRFCWLFLFGTVFGTYFISHLQFTSAAYLSGFLGMLIFVQRTSRKSLWAAAAWVVLGSLIRFDTFPLLLITTGAAAWLLSRRHLVEKIVFFAAILTLAVAGKAFDYSSYQRSPEWRAYQQFNGLRGGLHVTPELTWNARNEPAYKHVGWSENDFEMFKTHWLYEDPAVFSEDRLAYLKQHLSSDRSGKDAVILLLVLVWLAPAPVLLFCVVLLHRTAQPRPSLLRAAAILGPLLLVLGYLLITARLPARVAVPVLFATSLLLLIAARENGATCHQLSRTRMLPLVFLTISVFGLESLWFEARVHDQAAQRLRASLHQLAPGPDQTLVSSINAILLERLNPLTALAETRKFSIIHLMWSGGSPSFALQLRRHGSTSLFQSLAFDPHFWLLVPTAQRDRATSFALYIREHEHQNIQMIPVTLSDGEPAVFPDFTVLKAVPASRP